MGILVCSRANLPPKEEGEAARKNVVMSAGKRSCPDLICYLLSVTNEVSFQNIPGNLFLRATACIISRVGASDAPAGCRSRPTPDAHLVTMPKAATVSPDDINDDADVTNTKVAAFDATTPRELSPAENRVRLGVRPTTANAEHGATHENLSDVDDEDVPYNSLKSEDVMTLGAEDLNYAVIIFCMSPRVPLHWKLYYSSIVTVIVCVQFFAAIALVVMVVAQKCGEPGMGDCGDGSFCLQFPTPGLAARCWPCGGNMHASQAANGAEVAENFLNAMRKLGLDTVYLGMLSAENLTFVRKSLPAFCLEGVGLLQADCDACYDHDSDTYTARSDVLYGRVVAMSFFDWMMFLLCSNLVASSVRKEMVEIRTCFLLLEDEATRARRGVHTLWMVLLTELAFIRQTCIMPLVIATVPIFSLGMGMDALNVALNSLAVLFILEVDNTMYAMTLSPRQQEYLSGRTIEVSPRRHPSSMLSNFLDVTITFCSIFVPLLWNLLVGQGAGVLVSPLLEAAFLSTFIWLVLMLAWTMWTLGTETRFCYQKRGRLVAMVTIVVALHGFLLMAFFGFSFL